MAANRKILIAMSMLLVAIFASVSVTFAWFSTSTQATAIFDITIKSDDALLWIKTDDDKGYNEDERVDNFAFSDVELIDLGYVKGSSGRRLVHEDGTTALKTDYIMQQYTLYTNMPSKSVYFMTTESKVESTDRARGFSMADKSYWLNNGKIDEKIAKFYGTTNPDMTNDRESKIVWRKGQSDETVYYFNTAGGAYVTQAANAARVMVFPGELYEIPSTEPTFIWNPNDGKGYDVKNDDGSYRYDQVSSYFRNAIMANEYNDSTDRSAAENTVDYLETADDPLMIDSSLWRSVASNAEDYYAKVPYKYSVTLVLWLEGKDPDCFNAIKGDTVFADFTFLLI